MYFKINNLLYLYEQTSKYLELKEFNWVFP